MLFKEPWVFSEASENFKEIAKLLSVLVLGCISSVAVEERQGGNLLLLYLSIINCLEPHSRRLAPHRPGLWSEGKAPGLRRELNNLLEAEKVKVQKEDSPMTSLPEAASAPSEEHISFWIFKHPFKAPLLKHQ